MTQNLTKDQQLEILAYFDDKTLPKPKWYEDMEYPTFIINPNDFDDKEIEDYCYIDFHDNNFSTFDGFGKLFIKHKTHSKWYCYYHINFWNANNNITLDCIPTEIAGEYIIFINDIPKLVKEKSSINDISQLSKIAKLEISIDEINEKVFQEYISPHEIMEIFEDNDWNCEFQDVGFEENWKIISTKDNKQLVFDGDYYFGGVSFKYTNINNE